MRNADMPAYPTMLKAGDIAKSEGGLTKREHFAALAMQGMMANEGALRRVAEGANEEMVGPNYLMATACVNIADAILAELERTK